jgi:hypothetical protein
MPTRRLPNTIATVIRVLTTARNEWKNTPVAANRAISTDQWNQLNDAVPTSFLNRFLKEASDVDLALAAQAPLTNQFAAKADQLAMFISHFHQVLDLGITRGYFQAGARSYYGRDLNATTIPDLSSYQAIGEAAQKIVDGDVARQTAEGGSFKAMNLPSVEEINGLREEFVLYRNQSEQALVNTDTQREELQTLYAQAQALAVDIYDTVEFFYRKDPDASSRRVKCERWGLVYAFEPTPGNPTPPTPPPGP